MKEDSTQSAKALLVFEFSDFLDEGCSQFVLISLFYQTIQILLLKGKSIYLASVHLDTVQHFKQFWKNEKLVDFLEEYTTPVRLSTIKLEDFEIIVTHNYYEEKVMEMVTSIQKHKQFSKNAVFSLLSLNTMTKNIYPLFSEFLKSSPLFKFTIEQQDRINEFRRLLKESYQPFNIHEMNDLFQAEINAIDRVNRSARRFGCKTMLVLDDFKRTFFLGDTCFWMSELKEISDRLEFKGELHINCLNNKVYDFLTDAFTELNTENWKFYNKEWRDIDFSKYDMIICHNDSVYNLLMNYKILVKRYPIKINQIPIYHLYAQNHKEVKSVWSLYDKLKQVNNIGTDLKILKNIRKGRYLEIKIVKKEMDWANIWYKRMGVQSEDNVVFIQNDSSYNLKNINENVYLQLIKWICSYSRTWVLIFDFKGENKLKVLKEKLSFNHINIISANSLTMRQEMCLLSSSFIKGIISPDTGIGHLSNGIYLHLVNHAIIAREEQPFIVIYTGKNLQLGYHPKIWWKHSLVNCAIFMKTGAEIKKLIDLKQFKGDLIDYQRVALPPNKITFELFKNYLLALNSFLAINN